MEMLVLVGIIVVLLSIFIPYLLKVRETDNRVRCADNLRTISWALQAYAGHNQGAYPRVVYEPAVRPQGYAAFTGPDAGDPFAAGSQVQPSDVTASLWLLVRIGYLGNEEAHPTRVFICPSTWDTPDPLTDAQGRAVKLTQRSNFRGGRNLSYSYCSAFSSAPGFRLVDWQKPKFVVMADKNPGVRKRGSNVARPAAGAPPLEMAMANSNNHGQAGQNVLYADSHVSWEKTPYCGQEGDNIYTALAPAPVTGAKPDQLQANGVCGPQYSPAWDADSYLVPTADEMDGSQFPPPVRKPATTTAITTTRTTTTTTTATTTTSPAPASHPTTLP